MKALFLLSMISLSIFTSCMESEIPPAEQAKASDESAANQTSNKGVTDGCSQNLSLNTYYRSCFVSNGLGKEYVKDIYCANTLMETEVVGTCKTFRCNSGYQFIAQKCVQKKVCTPRRVSFNTCHMEGAVSASAKSTCHSTGMFYMTEACTARSCRASFELINGKCVRETLDPSLTCTPGTQKIDNCIQEISGALTAQKISKCNGSGTYDVQSCKLIKCQSSHYKEGNQCRVNSCTPNQATYDICTQTIQNASLAKRKKICNTDGSGFSSIDICRAESCLDGYILQNNKCVTDPNRCITGTKRVESCVNEISSAESASKTFTCNSDGSETAGSCVLEQCQSNYNIQGNNCILNVCAPNSKTYETCTTQIPNALRARILKTCNNTGSALASTSQCLLEQCATGFIKNGNICEVDNTPSENDLKVFLDLKLFDPDLDGESRWLSFKGSFPQDIPLGKHILNSENPLSIKLKVQNYSTSSINLVMKTTAKDLVITLPTSISAGNYDVIEIKLNTTVVKEISELFTFDIGGAEFTLRVTGEVN